MTRNKVLLNNSFGRGFTLMETIIYIALFGLIMSGLFQTAYMIILNSRKMNDDLIRVNDTYFVLNKTEYYMRTADVIVEPAEGAESSRLAIKIGTSDILVERDATEKNVTVKKDSLPKIDLASGYANVEGLTFRNETAHVTANFIIDGKSYKIIISKHAP
ncbi:MAG: hypothetical protein A3G52_01285 [Candidatus Taylorbacteria bacterium RIFCSPLOWO2_12_FULL_43_20]|uniref:Prepilin-type N-terminal cleavage/methylation domain-containing protein n=1 Tax=Candidatus Taylorbacteria bacterium RIFCSPLOWO2_12_FULL_43_20 TaxID=1802332 RepID=A0A1G2P591_9BACT|nr:MAG: hypothetical protein A3B98_04405 [Candidatus Taylorbacteria bacterium RIFCSPHIGHO2_02_FULL_43_55]OHA30052.1 MAG: hypothetical protein A3E92_03365 [Candidatus Taylorbacteria bacterium RIFCSPHIGHO2_12_FULL_42_34]OHA39533.1 MAG: hypothetical protein A3H58_02665 [Candidatus Taylorbacteria bacterium RIFCSPLOWO2_02_FULL_43_22b]OHA42869.1 MAG: hypothetical protein A3G52_01285 [Candidatus Taylorbacteria bacterium RIFCSPLOWO2_12_FULL_43_20]